MSSAASPRGRLLLLPLVAALAAAVFLCGLRPARAAADEWHIKGSTMSELGLSKESTAITAGNITMTSKPGIKIACEAAKGEGTLIAGGKDEATVEFTKCTVPGSEKFCPVSEPVVAKFKGSLASSEELSYDLLEPAGSAFATIKIKGELCALGEEFELLGSLAAELLATESTEQPLILSEEIAETAGTKAFLSEHAATVVGELAIGLTGKYKGAEWGDFEASTALCEANFPACPLAALYPVHTALKGSLESGTSATMEGSFGLLSCGESSLEGETLAEVGEPLSAKASALSFGSCTFGKTECSVEAEHLPYELAIASSGSGNGTMTVSASGETPQLHLTCGKAVNCTAKGNLELTFEGGEPGRIVAESEPLSGEGGCAEFSFSATYVLSMPGFGFAFLAQPIVPDTTKLCSMAPTSVAGRLQCPNNTAYSGEVLGELAAGVVEFKSRGGPTTSITCNEMSYKGQFANNGDPLAGEGITVLTFTNNTGGTPGQRCPSSIGGAGATAALTTEGTLNGSYFRYSGTGNPTGGANFRTAAGAAFIKFVIYDNTNAVIGTCVFGAPGLVADVANGSAGHTLLTFARDMVLDTGPQPLCPPGLKMTAIATLRRPGGKVFLAHDGR